MISGPARSGKDTVADIIQEEYPQHNFKRFAFAKALKEELEDHIREKYGVSVWDDSKKYLFRQELIDYGCAKRKETNGQYWVQKFLDIFCENDINENYIITDFRFGGENGEKELIKQKLMENYFFSENFVQSMHIIRIKNNEPILPIIPEEIQNEDGLRKDADKLLFLEWKEPFDKEYIKEKIKSLKIKK